MHKPSLSLTLAIILIQFRILEPSFPCRSWKKTYTTLKRAGPFREYHVIDISPQYRDLLCGNLREHKKQVLKSILRYLILFQLLNVTLYRVYAQGSSQMRRRGSLK
jgi:hypothetical protein